MPNGWDFTLVVLATYYVHASWFHGSLFAGWRAYFEARGGWLGELMTCPLCLAFWNALLQVLVLWLPGAFLPLPWGWLWRLPLFVLAAAGAAFLVWNVPSWAPPD